MHNGDQIFTIHNVIIPVKKPGETIYLIPFGDIHRFAPLCDEDKWLEFLAWAKTKENCYFLGMGDYDEMLSYSERKSLLTAFFHDSTEETIDGIFRKNTNKLIDELLFMRGRLIGLVEGNHYGVLQSGISTTQVMCDKLKCKYLGVSSFIRLSFKYGSKSCALDIWAHHGKGAARLVGGSLNSVQQMMDAAEADIYLMGHDHKKAIGTKTKLTLSSGGNNFGLSHKKILFGRTGSFLRGYVPEHASYVAKGAMSPTDMGVLKIELTPKRSQKGVNDIFYVDIHCSV
jgi:hypothetical protein